MAASRHGSWNGRRIERPALFSACATGSSRPISAHGLCSAAAWITRSGARSRSSRSNEYWSRGSVSTARTRTSGELTSAAAFSRSPEPATSTRTSSRTRPDAARPMAKRSPMSPAPISSTWAIERAYRRIPHGASPGPERLPVRNAQNTPERIRLSATAARSRRPGDEPHPQLLEAVREVRAQAPRRCQQLDPVDPPDQLLDHDRDLEPGEVRAEAEVGAAAPERGVLVALAGQDQPVRLREHLGVAARRREPDHDALALADRRGAQLGVLRGGATEVPDRRGQPDQLVDAGGVQRRVVAQRLHRPRVLDQLQQAERHALAGGLVAGHDEQREVVVELDLRQRPAVDLHVGEDREHVLARASLPLLDQRPAERAQLG